MPKPLDQPTQNQICALLTVGCPLQTAADYTGCSLANIQQTAKHKKTFAANLRQSQARTELTHLKNIFAAAEETKHWRASTWLLERLYPDRYGPRKPAVITAEQITNLMQQFSEIVAEEVPIKKYRNRIHDRLAQLLCALRRAATSTPTNDDA